MKSPLDAFHINGIALQYESLKDQHTKEPTESVVESEYDD